MEELELVLQLRMISVLAFLSTHNEIHVFKRLSF